MWNQLSQRLNQRHRLVPRLSQRQRVRAASVGVLLFGAACGETAETPGVTAPSTNVASSSLATPIVPSNASNSGPSIESAATQPPTGRTVSTASTLPGDAERYPSPLMVYPRSCRTYATQDECAEIEPGEETFAAAEIRGEISMHDGCVFLLRDDNESVAIFPYGTQWDEAGRSIVLNSGEVLVDGDSIYGGGQGGPPGTALEEQFGPELAAGLRRCLAVLGAAPTIAEFGWSGTVERITEDP
jgi:hypothetical protein